MSRNARARAGFSLVEILVVLTILGLFARAAVPALGPSQIERLDLAAARVAEAARFARSEAIRTGGPFGILVAPADNRVRVLRADTSTTPATPIFDVLHPISKHVYDLDLDDDPLTRGVDLAASWAWFGAGTCVATGLVAFDGAAAPRCGFPWALLLDQGSVTLSLGLHARVVRIDGETGRVSVQ